MHDDDAAPLDDVDELELAAPVRLRYLGTLVLLGCLALELLIAYRPPRWLLVDAGEVASRNGHVPGRDAGAVHAAVDAQG